MTGLRKGTIFLNRYVLLQPVGRGSVSVVYEAEDTVNSCQVAIRLLSPDLAGDQRARDRVRHPAMIMTMLRNTGVPHVYEFGDAPLGNGSAIAYSVLEFLTGESLDSRLARGPLPWRDAVAVATTVADLLTVAHTRGLALGGVSPAGILLTPDGPRVVDLDGAGGIATPAPVAPTRLRRARTQPESVPSGPTPADDIRALGALLREMVSGTDFADLPPGLPTLWQACLGGDEGQPDAATLSMELWGLLSPGAAGPRPPQEGAHRHGGEHRLAVESRASVGTEQAEVETAARARGALARAALDRKPRPTTATQRPPAQHPSAHPSLQSLSTPADHDAAESIPVGYHGQGGRHRRRRPAWTGPSQATAYTGRA